MQPLEAFSLNEHGRLGQAFETDERFNLLWVSVPSWSDDEGGFTLTLWDSPQRKRRLAWQAFTDIRDNSRVTLTLSAPLPPGVYYWEAAERTGQTRVGLYAQRLEEESAEPAYFDGKPDRRVRFLFGVQYSPYVGTTKRQAWTARSGRMPIRRDDVPHWIWYPETPIADNATRYFRRTFEVRGRVRAARMLTTGDDAFTLWLNGREVTRGGQPILRDEKVTSLLRPGRNVLAASVLNAVAPAGLLMELRIEYADGRTVRLFSDSSWRCSRDEAPGWQELAFDDSRWAKAVEIGDVFAGPWYGTGNLAEYYPNPGLQEVLEGLRREPPVRAEVRVERGAPRLYLNGREVFPLLAWSNDLAEFARDFTFAGIDLLHPHYSLEAGWRADGSYDWSGFVSALSLLLSLNPRAYFLVRLGLFAPAWWRSKHPDELIGYAVPGESTPPEFGPVQQPSFASEAWRRDTERALRSFLRFVEASPLRSRVIGYQIANGIYGEWHYFGARHLPDTSQPMQRACGTVPDVKARLNSTLGLFRDPAKEAEVIRYYARFHEVCADTILYFARIVKQETRGRALCGAFYTYLLQNLWIQEGGHLAPQRLLNSPYIDFVACPYTYQGDAHDGAGNWLGRSRGLAGDGGYRVLLESIKRHGKLYFAEIDPATCLETQPEQMGNGGPGSETLRGSRLILRRDLAHMMAEGNAGWLFDIGPGWYAEREFLEEIRAFVRLGRERLRWNLASPAQVCAVFQPQSFFVTAHWRSAPGYGEYDLFNDYFLNRQCRAIHRLGAPVDFLDLADLRAEDVRRYRLFLIMNGFYLTDEQVERLRRLFAGSGATVVWVYAPALVAPEGASVERVSRLTGIQLTMLTDTAPLRVRWDAMQFGLPGAHAPRFAVDDPLAEALGYWVDGAGVALARKQVDGYTSAYAGTAPIPDSLLRRLAAEAGADVWSSAPDIVYACADCVSVTATTAGEREVRLPRPMRIWGGSSTRRQVHRLSLAQGDTVVFVP